MVRHPGSKIALSRGALQVDSIADRFRRQIRGEPKRLEDGGLAVEAIALIRQNGLIDQSDFHDVVDSDPVFSSVESKLIAYQSAADQQKALGDELKASLGAPPKMTHLDGRAVSPEQLARVALDGKTWTEFDLSRDGVEGWGPSHDPDARPETRVRYVGLDAMIDLIHKSLARGEAVVWGSVDHALVIYGGDYDASGKPLSYLIKDSLPPYIYRAPAETIHGDAQRCDCDDAAGCHGANDSDASRRGGCRPNHRPPWMRGLFCLFHPGCCPQGSCCAYSRRAACRCGSLESSPGSSPPAPHSPADAVRTGPAAYGDWRTDAPGVRRLITPADLPPPFATLSAGNPSRLAARKPSDVPKAPDGFSVDLFAEGLSVPRVVRTAPNGDIFVAESGAGRVRIFRPDGASAPPIQGAVFAEGLERPFGIAFYPSADPHWVYVATPGSVVRYPYRSGDLKASGPGRDDR